MSDILNLKELESKAWKSFFDDGLWDIYLGLLLALMGVSNLLDKTSLSENQATAVYLGLMLVVMVAFGSAKKFITVPRMGQVKFGAVRQKKQKNVRLILFLSFVLGLVAYWFFAGIDSGKIEGSFSIKTFFPLLYAGNMIVVSSLVAYFMDFERLYFIGLMFALPVPLDFWLTKSHGIDLGYTVFLIPAFLVVSIGLWYFLRFLKKYPLAQERV